MFYCYMIRRGYTGDALRVCLRGECFHDDECPNHLACFDYQVDLHLPIQIPIQIPINDDMCPYHLVV